MSSDYWGLCYIYVLTTGGREWGWSFAAIHLSGKRGGGIEACERISEP